MFAAPGQPGTLVGAWRSLVSAPDWGSGGRWFESSRPDHTFPQQSAAMRDGRKGVEAWQWLSPRTVLAR